MLFLFHKDIFEMSGAEAIALAQRVEDVVSADETGEYRCCMAREARNVHKRREEYALDLTESDLIEPGALDDMLPKE